MRAKSTLLGSAVVAALIGISIAVVLATSEKGAAGRAPAFVPLARAEVTPQLKANIELAAKAEGIPYDSIVEVGGSGTGEYRRSAFLGVDKAGVVKVSLSAGFGFTPFLPENKLFRLDNNMIVGEGFSGPPSQVRSVGMTGAVKPNVDHVTIAQKDGSITEAPLAKAPLGDLRFFASFSDVPEHFPTLVRAYDTRGMLVGQYRSQVYRPAAKAH